LALTDKIAAEVIEEVSKSAPQKVKDQYNDNLLWIQQAGENKLVVGSQARVISYFFSRVRFCILIPMEELKLH
jgi:urocanate hydratase